MVGLLVLLAVFIVLVATSINGTSSGAFFPIIYAGTDPALLYGSPNLIRTDEWNVQTVWAIAQYEQGLPAVNQSFPGGMDTTIPQDLPRVDWSAVFRPHLWGFWAMDVGHAQAWKWWLPLFAVAASAYAFCLTWLPRAPVTAMVFALGFTASPFFQWWLLQTTLWPVAWGFAVLAACAWIYRSSSIRAVWVGLPIVAYLTVVMGMGIYVPFILPIALVVAFAVAGIAISAARDRGWRFTLRRTAMLLTAGAAAGVVLALWLATRWEVVSAFLSTAYPGERLEPTGGGASVQGIAGLLGSAFTNTLKNAGTFLDGNASESATFFLPGLFLLPVVVWLLWRARTDSSPLPWAPVLSSAGGLVLVAFAFIPGWDPVANLLLLDRSTTGRVRIGIGFASFVVLVMVAALVLRRRRPGWMTSLVGPFAFVACQIVIAVALWRESPEMLRLAGIWWVFMLLGAVVILASARARPLVAAVAMFAVSLGGSYDVNPLYVGVFDLRETAPARAVEEISEESPGAWVGLGAGITTATLLESGAETFNGFQGAPNRDMWSLIDPAALYEFEWNRLAGISWVTGPGEPSIENPYPDQIRVTFDACSNFAQDNVAFVLSDSSQSPESACLRAVERFELNQTALTIWRVVSESKPE